jgi:hypothetical protein
LVDRKFGHGNSIFKEINNGVGEVNIVVHNDARIEAIFDQLSKQLKAVSNNGSKVKWEISTELGAKGIEELFKRNPKNILGLENVEVVHIQKNIIY